MVVWGSRKLGPRARPPVRNRSRGRTGPASPRSGAARTGLRPALPKYYRWPEVGRVVQIHLAGETLPLPAKILDHDTSADCIVIGAPGGRGQGAMIAEPGDRFVLSWVLPNGIAKLDAAFLSWVDDPSSTPTSWRLEPVSDVRVVERRRHRRLSARQNIAVRVAQGTLPGVLVDISEGGMRCLVDTVTPAKLTRERLESVVTVRGAKVGLRGLVTWAKHHGGHVEVGIVFDRLRRQDVELIRAHVRSALSATA